MRVKFYYSAKLARKNRKPDNTNKHKVPFPKLAREVIRTSDIVLEIVDARFIDKTRNTKLEDEVKNQSKQLIVVLNKADLVEVNEVKKNYDLKSLEPYVFFSTKNRIGRTRLRHLIHMEARSSSFEKARVGIIGYPNTGKSSVINALAGGGRAGTSPQAGFTKGIQKIKFSKNILLLDTPGVIGTEDGTSTDTAVTKRHAEISVKRYDSVKYPDMVVHQIMTEHPGLLEGFYGIDADGDVEMLIEELGKKWHLVKKGGEIHVDRTARQILKAWQDGKMSGKKK